MTQSIEDRKPSQLNGKDFEEGFGFLLWQAELNRELSLYWKSLFKQ